MALCAICLTPINPMFRSNPCPKCNLVAHRTCLKRWTAYGGTCPTCRTPLPSPRTAAPPRAAPRAPRALNRCVAAGAFYLLFYLVGWACLAALVAHDAFFRHPLLVGVSLLAFPIIGMAASVLALTTCGRVCCRP